MVRKITKRILKEAELKPVKYRGQNFLVSAEYLKKIAAAADIKNGDTILEIGPGTGNLTQALLNAGATVVAVEKDQNLCEILKLKVKNEKFKIIERDILLFDETEIKTPYKVVANIPYYITGKIIQKFLFSPNPPTELILMTQKEVGERICAKPPQTNYLSSLIQSFAQVKILFKVGRGNFWPKPKVDSTVIKITPNIKNLISNKEEFIEFLKKAFKQPRQTLFNNLKNTGLATRDKLNLVFEELELNQKVRPQNLDTKILSTLYEKIMTNA